MTYIDDGLLSCLSDFRAILTVEEHSIVGGLASAVAEYYADKVDHPYIYKMGLPDAYPHGASHETLLDEYQLNQEGIYNKIKEIVEGKNYE